MAARRFLALKILLGLAAFAVALAALGTLALRRYLPPEKLKELLVQQAQKALAREVRLRDVSLSLVGGLGVAGLEISEAGGFAKGSFASIDSFVLKVQWRPLLSRRVVVDQISVSGLSLQVVKRRGGALNVSDLGGAAKDKSEKKEKEGPPALPIELSVRRAKITGARAAYSDEASGARWTVSDLAAQAAGFSLNAPFQAAVSFKAEGRGAAGPISARLAFDGDVDLAGLDKEKLDVAIKSLEASALGWELKAAGKVRNALAPEADIQVSVARGSELVKGALKAWVRPGPPLAISAEFDLKTREFKPADLGVAKVPAGLVAPEARVSGRLALSGEDLELKALSLQSARGELSASGKVRKALSKPEPALLVSVRLDLPPLQEKDFAGLAQVPAGLALPATKLRVKAFVGLDAASLETFDAEVGQSRLNLSGRVGGLASGSPVLDLKLKDSTLALAEAGSILPAGRELGLTGRAVADMSIAGPASQPILQGSARLEGVGARAAGLELSGFSGSVAANPAVIRLDGLSGTVWGGRLRVSGSVADYRREPDIKMHARLDRLDLGSILGAKAPPGKEASPGAKPPAASPAASSSRKPVKTSGSFKIDEIVHPHFQGRDLSLEWGLTGVTPDFKALSGSAALRVKSGEFESMEALTEKFPAARVLLMPLIVLQRVGKLPVLQGMPDLSKVNFTEIVGDYAFERGVMTLKQSRLVSTAVAVDSRGQVDLGGDKLDLQITARIGNLVPLEFNAGGTLSDPKVRLSARTLVDPLKQLLQGKPLDKIFKRDAAPAPAPEGGESEPPPPVNPVETILDLFKRR